MVCRIIVITQGFGIYCQGELWFYIYFFFMLFFKKFYFVLVITKSHFTYEKSIIIYLYFNFFAIYPLCIAID